MPRSRMEEETTLYMEEDEEEEEAEEEEEEGEEGGEEGEEGEEREKEEDIRVPQQTGAAAAVSEMPASETDNATVRTLAQSVVNAPPRGLLPRRSSNNVELTSSPLNLKERPNGGDMSLRPRYLRERSATHADVTSIGSTEPAWVPRSKASAFLLGVLAKAREASVHESRRATLEPIRSSVTNTPPFSALQRKLPGPLLQTTGRSASRRGPILSAVEPSATDELQDVPAERRRTSQRSMTTIVHKLQAYKQKLPQQLELLQSLLYTLNSVKRDDAGGAPIFKDLVDAGLIVELASIMREFRFHIGLQMCTVSILSVLVEESALFAYMMSELHLDILLQKSAAVHAGHERLVLLMAAVAHTIEESNVTVNAQAYHAEKTAKERRQSAYCVDMVVAEYASKAKRPMSSSHSNRNLPTSRHSSQSTIYIGGDSTPMRAVVSSAPASGTRPRQAFAAEVAPPVLGANYRLQFARKLKSAAVAPLQGSLPVAERSGHSELIDIDVRCDRPTTCPAKKSLALELTSEALTAAIYSGGSIFVEPSPLSQRLSYRGSFSAGGVRRHLSAQKKTGRVTRQLSPQKTQTDPSLHVLEPPPPTPVNPLSSACRPLEPSGANIAPFKMKTEIKKGDGVSGEATDEEESYEDDFDPVDPEDDRSLPNRSDPVLGSDGELIDMLHDISEQNTAEASDSRTPTPPTALKLVEAQAITTIRASEPAEPTSQEGTILVMQTSNNRKKERRGRLGKQRTPLYVRPRRQLQDPPSDNRGHSRNLSQCQSRSQTGPKTTRPTSLPKLPASGGVGAGNQAERSPRLGSDILSGKHNNQDFHPSRPSQPDEDSTLKESVSASVEAEARPECEERVTRHKDEGSDAAEELLGPAALKRIQALYAEGLQHHKENHLSLAIDCYEAALRLPTADGRKFASLHVNLGSALMAQSRISHALVAFEEAKRIQPNNIKAIYNCALALLHLDRPMEAQQQLRRVLELEPSHERATLALDHIRGDEGAP